MENIDQTVVAGFGDEWSRFDQSDLPMEERTRIFDSYFSIFPWDRLPKNATGFDAGCGSVRWASICAKRVGTLNLIDASSEALKVARRNLRNENNVNFFNASVDAMPLTNGSQDFGYSLGVLHHIPNIGSGMRACVTKLKPGAPFLVYLYYRFDNRSLLFRTIWSLSNILRLIISRLPHPVRYVCSQVIAATVYWPLAILSNLVGKLGLSPHGIPLSGYRDKSFYTMRTDALDRFGTKLEQRFTLVEIEALMKTAGLENISFSTSEPYWCAVGYRKN